MARVTVVKPEALEAAATIASTDKYRPNLNSVLVNDAGIVTATDGHALIQVSAAMEMDAADYPAVTPDGMHAPSGDGVILPLSAVKEAAKAARKVKSPIPSLRSVAVCVNETHGQLISTDLDTTSRTEYRPLEGPFPNVEQVYPKAPIVFSIGFDPALLARTLEAFAEVSDSPVRLSFYSDHHAVLISSVDGAAKGLVMPRLIDSEGGAQ